MLRKMPTIAEDVGGEDRGNRAGQSVESGDKGAGRGRPEKDVSDSTDVSPTKSANVTTNNAPMPGNPDELVQMLQKGASGSGPPGQNKVFGVNQFVHPYSRVRSREEIEAEVLAELREIDKTYNII